MPELPSNRGAATVSAYDPWPFADVVIQAQREQGLTFRAAAIAAGVSVATYHRAVHGAGQPSLSTATRLLHFAGVGPSEAARLQGFLSAPEVKHGPSR